MKIHWINQAKLTTADYPWCLRKASRVKMRMAANFLRCNFRFNGGSAVFTIVRNCESAFSIPVYKNARRSN
ncbi:MAG: hypothetical protein D6814_14265 [Calditrichaeota bacterium]|nr:MAG: hypothetical protein D6814_14265 [Calditrichota bacterium]